MESFIDGMVYVAIVVIGIVVVLGFGSLIMCLFGMHEDKRVDELKKKADNNRTYKGGAL